MFRKLQAARCGKTIYITPEELADASFERQEPYTVDDIITYCTSFSLQYQLIDSPQSIKVYKTV